MTKSHNLEVLAASGIPVPRGFTLSSKHYQEAVEPWVSQIASNLRSPVAIEAIIRAAVIPNNTRQFLADQLARLPATRRFAVRSSGTVVRAGRTIQEDGSGMALAGQFDTFLNVPRELVPSAVQRCWASLFNERSIVSFGADREYVVGSAMSVVIQEMIPAKASAVMMTCDPTGNGEIGGIEFTWGPCEAIVSGIVNPDEATFHRQSGSILSTKIGSKAWRVAYADFSEAYGNTLKTPSAHEDRVRLSLAESVIQDLITLGMRIEHLFECPQDIEAVVTQEDRVVVTQARPVTTLPAKFVPLLQLQLS